MPRITVPAALTGGSSADTVAVDGTTVKEAFEAHAAEYGPGLRDSVLDGGEIKEFINVYVNGEEVGHLDGLETPVSADDRIRVIPAASGGTA